MVFLKDRQKVQRLDTQRYWKVHGVASPTAAQSLANIPSQGEDVHPYLSETMLDCVRSVLIQAFQSSCVDQG